MASGILVKSLSRIFVSAAIALLLLTGFAKLLSPFSQSAVFAELDPLLGIKFRYLLVLVGSLEIGIVLHSWHFGPTTKSLLLIAWLATCITIYRAGLFPIGWKAPCTCLGRLTDFLHVSPKLADDAMVAILTYLLTVSYGLLFWHWRLNCKSISKVSSCSPNAIQD